MTFKNNTTLLLFYLDFLWLLPPLLWCIRLFQVSRGGVLGMWEKKQDKEKGNFFLIKHFASNIKTNKQKSTLL